MLQSILRLWGCKAWLGLCPQPKSRALWTQSIHNSFPRGINDNCLERQKRPEKYYWFSHAERNAIFNAALVGIPLKNCRMYTNGIPCTSCAHAIINSGIIEVIVDANWKSRKDGWAVEETKSLQMFAEASISITYHEFKFIELKRYIDGKIR